MAAKETSKALMIYLNNRESLEDLSDAERGRLLLALMDYQEFGKEPVLEGDARVVFKFLRRDVDQNIARWEEECARRSAAGKKSAALRAAKNFGDEVSCEGDAEAEEQNEVSSHQVERREAAYSSPQQREAVLNAVEDCSTTSTNTNTNSNPNSNSQSNSKSNSNPQSDPEPRTQSGSRAAARSARAGGREAEFDRFWTAYPRKVGKQAARRAFERVRLPVEQLLAALERQRNDPQWHRENGRYIPHPATWLTQARWEDEPAPEPQDCGAYGVECL